MPVTPDDFDSLPLPAHEPSMRPAGIPVYPPPVRVSPATPAKGGTPGWAKLLLILVILVIVIFIALNGVQRREVSTSDTPAIDTMVAATSTMRLQRGVRRYMPSPFRVSTWPLGPGAGAGVDIVFDSVTVRDGETLVTLDIDSDHDDVILYDRLLLVVDGKTTLYSTTGLEGGRQSSFGGIRRIDILRGEHVVLIARFPALPDDAKTLKFISPVISGTQDGWAWENIALRDVAVSPEV